MQYLQTILYLVIGRFPILITISTIFIAGTISGFRASIISTLTVIGIILFSIIITLTVSKILSKTFLKGFPSSFILELPPYRKPQIGRIIIRSFFDKTLSSSMDIENEKFDALIVITPSFKYPCCSTEMSIYSVSLASSW